MLVTKRTRTTLIRGYFYVPGSLQTLEEAAQTLVVTPSSEVA